MHSLS
jgi:hypothetical protein